MNSAMNTMNSASKLWIVEYKRWVMYQKRWIVEYKRWIVRRRRYSSSLDRRGGANSNCNKSLTNANCFRTFCWKCRKIREFPLENDDFLSQNGRLFSNNGRLFCNFRYSYSTDVLGRCLELVSGMRLDEFLQKNLFVPLKMFDTGIQFCVANDGFLC